MVIINVLHGKLIQLSWLRAKVIEARYCLAVKVTGIRIDSQVDGAEQYSLGCCDLHPKIIAYRDYELPFILTVGIGCANIPTVAIIQEVEFVRGN